MVVAIALVLIGASTAQAAVTYLYTAAQVRSDRVFRCLAVNTGPTSVTVNFQVVDNSGNVDHESGPQPIAPGEVGLTSVAAGLGSDILYCKFIVLVGNKVYLRASACVNDSSGSACDATSDAR
jgi:hypothetical protein